MTKAEAIKTTGYTEEELVYLGIIAMKIKMKDARNNSEDDESWSHYDALVKAYDALEVEYKVKAEKEVK